MGTFAASSQTVRQGSSTAAEGSLGNVSCCSAIKLPGSGPTVPVSHSSCSPLLTGPWIGRWQRWDATHECPPTSHSSWKSSGGFSITPRPRPMRPAASIRSKKGAGVSRTTHSSSALWQLAADGTTSPSAAPTDAVSPRKSRPPRERPPHLPQRSGVPGLPDGREAP